MSSTRFTATLSTILCVLLFTPMLSSPASAANDCNTVMTTQIDQFYQGPVYVDSYWTNASQSLNSGSTSTIIEREVGPAEGKATLAVVFVNRSLKDISAITGYLSLPDGYEPTGTSGYTDNGKFAESNPIASANGNRLGFNKPAVASYNSIVTSKSSFTLYFDINVTDQAKVGSIPTNLVLQYYITDQLGLCTSALITFPLVLSGKTILDISAPEESLTPNVPNTVNINIMNKGTADATGVVATIVGLGDSGSSKQNSDGSLTLSSSSTKIVNLGDKVFNVGTISAGTSVSVHTIIYPGKDAAGTVQNMNILLSFSNSHGDLQSTTVNTGLVVSPSPVDASINVSYLDSDKSDNSHILTAEKLEDLGFVITNNSPTEISDLVVSIVPDSTSVTIVGDSKWSIPTLDPDETKQISIKAIAAKSIIATPTTFTANISYIANGESKTDSQKLGAFVIGEINLALVDVSVNLVGDTPNIAGNLLNQGNTNALYASVELVSPKSQPTNGMSTRSQNGNADSVGSPQFNQEQRQNFADSSNPSQIGMRQNRTMLPQIQYVGDISSDSSIPFSIPVTGLKPGIVPITVKVKYADDLKNFHEVSFDSKAVYEQKQDTRQNKRQSGFELENIIIPIGIGAAAITGTIFVIKKKRKSKTSVGSFNSDLDSLLDEHLKK